jgi:hypothetical protein
MFLPFSFSEKLPAAGNLAFYSEGNDIKLNGQGFPPQIQRAGLTTVEVCEPFQQFQPFVLRAVPNKWLRLIARHLLTSGACMHCFRSN